MRKYLLLLISILVFFGVLGSVWVLGLGNKQASKIEVQPKKVEQPIKPQAQVVIENGEIRTEATVSAKTAFEALENLAQQNNLDLKTKRYDFGVFVEGIGRVENTKDTAWIYFVNGKSPEVAADKYELKPGDVVEWKYIKPTF